MAVLRIQNESRESWKSIPVRVEGAEWAAPPDSPTRTSATGLQMDGCMAPIMLLPARGDRSQPIISRPCQPRRFPHERFLRPRARGGSGIHGRPQPVSLALLSLTANGWQRRAGGAYRYSTRLPGNPSAASRNWRRRTSGAPSRPPTPHFRPGAPKPPRSGRQPFADGMISS